MRFWPVASSDRALGAGQGLPPETGPENLNEQRGRKKTAGAARRQGRRKSIPDTHADMSSSHSPRTSLKRKLSSELSEGVASRALQDRQDAWRRKIEELVGNLNDALYGARGPSVQSARLPRPTDF